MATGNFKYQYARLSIAEKLIAITIGAFILMALLTKLVSPSIERWFALPGDFFDFLMQPWSLISYSFLHGGLWHLLWNMYILYISGRIILNLFDGKRFLNIYFLGVISGGLAYVLADTLLMKTGAPLIGASAGVMAALIFVCTYIPNHEIRLIIFNVKLWHVGVFVVIVDVLQISAGADNLGGRTAHLGGALLGYMYARQLINGHDIGAGFAKFIDGISNTFKPRKGKAPLKTVYRKKKKKAASKVNYEKDAHQKKIDGILDKISTSGYESLSKAEKDFLFKAGKED